MIGSPRLLRYGAMLRIASRIVAAEPTDHARAAASAIHLRTGKNSTHRQPRPVWAVSRALRKAVSSPAPMRGGCSPHPTGVKSSEPGHVTDAPRSAFWSNLCHGRGLRPGWRVAESRRENREGSVTDYARQQ